MMINYLDYIKCPQNLAMITTVVIVGYYNCCNHCWLGEITQFILQRDGVELYRGLEYEFTDERTILPYQSYVYTLSACNSAGCTQSQGVMCSFFFLRAQMSMIAPLQMINI
jgi:hypothetical protein